MLPFDSPTLGQGDRDLSGGKEDYLLGGSRNSSKNSIEVEEAGENRFDVNKGEILLQNPMVDENVSHTIEGISMF